MFQRSREMISRYKSFNSPDKVGTSASGKVKQKISNENNEQGRFCYKHKFGVWWSIRGANMNWCATSGTTNAEGEQIIRILSSSMEVKGQRVRLYLKCWNYRKPLITSWWFQAEHWRLTTRAKAGGSARGWCCDTHKTGQPWLVRWTCT